MFLMGSLNSLVPPIRRKGLIVFPGALGDFICFLPTLKWIAETESSSSLELVMRSDFSDLLFTRAPSMSVRSIHCHEIGRLFASPGEVRQEIQDYLRSYAFVYSWFGADQPDFLRNLKALYPGNLRIFPFRTSDSTIHMTDYYLSGLENRPSRKIFPEIPLRPDAVAWCHRFWNESDLLGKRILTLAPGSGAQAKNWPPSFFRTVARWWRKRTGGKVLVIFGPVEEERMADDKFWEESLLISGLSLSQLAALQARCDLYLGNDSGITHLAAALGIPTVVLFGPTDHVQWGPSGRHVSIITRHLDCSPCDLSLAKACAHRRCLADLSPNKVTGLLEEILTGCVLDKGVSQL